jgi:hypothetical protein
MKAKKASNKRPRAIHVEYLDSELFGSHVIERERNYQYLPDAAKIARRTDNRLYRRGQEGN